MTKGVKITLAVVIVIFIASAAASVIILYPHDKDEKAPSRYVEISRDNEILYRIDIANEPDRTFRIEFEDGWNDVTIENGELRISDADCPDQTCVKTGVLRSEYLPIICLPHKLVIRFAD